MTNRLHIIGASPQGRYSFPQALKFLAQNSGRVALKLLNDVVMAIDRGCFDKQVNVIGHYFKAFNYHINPAGFLNKKLFEPGFNLSNQDIAPVFRAPDKMVSKIKHGFIAGSPPVPVHRNIIHATGVYCKSDNAIHPTAKDSGLSGFSFVNDRR